LIDGVACLPQAPSVDGPRTVSDEVRPRKGEAAFHQMEAGMVHADRYSVEKRLCFVQAPPLKAAGGDGSAQLPVVCVGQKRSIKPFFGGSKRSNGFLKIRFEHDGRPAACTECNGVRGRFEGLLFPAGKAGQTAGFQSPSFAVLAVKVEACFGGRQRLVHVTRFKQLTSANPVVRLRGILTQGCFDFGQGLVGSAGSCSQA
jgi:hypothetical protein